MSQPSPESPIRTMPTEPPTERMVELEATSVLSEAHLRNNVVRARHGDVCYFIPGTEPTPEEDAEYEAFVKTYMEQPR